MNRRVGPIGLAIATGVAGALLIAGCAMPQFVGNAAPAPDPNLVFFDGFDGHAGPIAGNPAHAAWRFDTGGGGWGNAELQVYTDSEANASLDGEGNLALTARRAGGGEITSARLTTEGTVSYTYGRAEARISLPAGTGLHPAFWLLGSDIDAVGWPRSGEIDVIETVNAADRFHTGIIAPRGNLPRGQQVTADGPTPAPLAGQFHNYWVERTPGRIVLGVDGITLLTATPFSLPDPTGWVFEKPFHLLLNLAVGGNWPGPVDSTTNFPATMLVDWVKVTKL